jgi:hypothetical protein
MSDHLIIQVRDAIKGQVTGLATTGSHVYRYSEVTQDEATLPALLIEYQEDQAEPAALGFPVLEQLAPVYLLHILVKQKGDYEQAAFLIRNEVETALLGSVQGKTVGGLVQWIRRAAAECQRDESADKPVYRLTLQLQANIRHLESRPDSIVLS